jgi:hypothetical protein
MLWRNNHNVVNLIAIFTQHVLQAFLFEVKIRLFYYPSFFLNLSRLSTFEIPYSYS